MRLFAAACAAAVLLVAGYVVVTSRTRVANANESAHVEPTSVVPDGPFVMFRNAWPGSQFGRLAIAPLPLSSGPRLIAPLSCERVHYASGWGVCMVTDEAHLPPRNVAYVFDAQFQPRHTLALTGTPIRARVSPDGRRAAMTVFEKGHSYAEDGFSTRTTVIDTASGRRLGDLEEFSVTKDGAAFKAVDFNFWGVTFARDGDRFFATLKTKGERYLIEGSIDARRTKVVRSGIECPSLSPDGTRIVFKKPLTTEVGWRLSVLELATGSEHALNQGNRSIDDQVDWFDDTHVVYHDSAAEGTGIWVLSIDGISPPRLLIPNAYSPAVQR